MCNGCSYRLVFVQKPPLQDEEVKVKRRNGRDPSLVLALCKAYGFTFFVAGFFKLAQDLLSFASPQILR